MSRRTTLSTGETYELGNDGRWRPVQDLVRLSPSPPPPGAIPRGPFPGATTVLAAAQQQGDEVDGGCSGYVKAVARSLNIFSLEGLDANQIVSRIQAGPWRFLGTDSEAALAAAAAGKFVVAGIARRGHGHVVVVLGRRAPSGYAEVAVQHWSSARGNNGIGIGEDLTSAFFAGEVGRVVYAAHEVMGTMVASAGRASGSSAETVDPKFGWLKAYNLPQNSHGYEVYWQQRRRQRLG